MTESIISKFYVSKKIKLCDDIKELYDRNTWLKALCKNPNSFPYLKDKVKKWIPAYIKYISMYCDDVEFLKKYESYIDFMNISINPNINKLEEILERHLDELDWWDLSENNKATPFLKKHKDLVIWEAACLNESKEMAEWIEELYESNELDMSDKWSFLSSNPFAINMLKKNISKVSIENLNTNENAIEFLRENPDHLDYKSICLNESKEAIKLIEEIIKDGKINMLSFHYLSANSEATDILKIYPDRINWEMTTINENVGELYKAFPEKIKKYIRETCIYPSVYPFIKDYLYYISPVTLAENPSIFCEDLNEYKNSIESIQKIIFKFKY